MTSENFKMDSSQFPGDFLLILALLEPETKSFAERGSDFGDETSPLAHNCHGDDYGRPQGSALCPVGFSLLILNFKSVHRPLYKKNKSLLIQKI